MCHQFGGHVHVILADVLQLLIAELLVYIEELHVSIQHIADDVRNEYTQLLADTQSFLSTADLADV